MTPFEVFNFTTDPYVGSIFLCMFDQPDSVVLSLMALDITLTINPMDHKKKMV